MNLTEQEFLDRLALMPKEIPRFTCDFRCFEQVHPHATIRDWECWTKGWFAKPGSYFDQVRQRFEAWLKKEGLIAGLDVKRDRMVFIRTNQASPGQFPGRANSGKAGDDKSMKNKQEFIEATIAGFGGKPDERTVEMIRIAMEAAFEHNVKLNPERKAQLVYLTGAVLEARLRNPDDTEAGGIGGVVKLARGLLDEVNRVVDGGI